MTNQGITKGTESSFWLETCPATNFPPLNEGLNVDGHGNHRSNYR
ncbi:MAG: hypothetical protein ACLQG5_04455 [Methanobacterium sp.]|jgi:hypothetical protein